MPGPFIDSPQSERYDNTRYDNSEFNHEISHLASFASPLKPNDNMIKAIRGNAVTLRSRLLATPRSRNALSNRQNPPGKSEFTPMLKSATMNRYRMANGDDKENGVRTPAALKAGFKLDATPVIDLSEVTSSSAGAEDQTPIPQVASSSIDISTPMIMPKRGEGGIIDNGNVLTLREQEQRLEQIDKENFGLKLKIHYMEENMRRSGPEANQIALRENSDLKVNKAILERDLKKNMKLLKAAERDLEEYRAQLMDYADKIKRRHISEAMQEEVGSLRDDLAQRDEELQELQAKFKELEQDDVAVERLQKELADLEAELQDKEKLLEQKEEQIDLLQKAEDAQDDTVSAEKERQLEEQAEAIEDLRYQMRQLEQEKDGELDTLEQRLEAANQTHNENLQVLQEQLEAVEQANEVMEKQLKAVNSPSKDRALLKLQDDLAVSVREKDEYIKELEDRLQLAAASAEKELQLVQQDADDARALLKVSMLGKDAELADLQKRLELVLDTQNDEEATTRQLVARQKQLDELLRKEAERSRDFTTLQESMEALRGENEGLKAAITKNLSDLQDMAPLRRTLADREAELATMKTKVEKHEDVAEKLTQAQNTISNQERSIKTLETTIKERSDELEVLRQHADEPDSQLEGVQNIVRARDTELESLRASADATHDQLEKIQRTAEERLHQLEELKVVLEKQKEEFEEEIEVLENTLEEAEQDKDGLQAQVKLLSDQARASNDVRAQLGPLERDLQAIQRDKRELQAEVQELNADLDAANEEKSDAKQQLRALSRELDEARQSATLRSPTTNASLREKLRASQDAVEQLNIKLADRQEQLETAEARLATRESPSAAQGLRQRLREMAAQHRRETAELQDLLRTTTVQLEDARRAMREGAAEAKKSAAESTAALLRDKDRKLQRLQQAREKGKVETALYAHETETLQLELEGLRGREREVGRLRGELAAGEKRHTAEIKGLAKQIQWLRAGMSRAEGFRSSLGFEKRWLQMQIDMYADCNKKQLRLIKDMGVRPPVEPPRRHSRLKVAGLAVIAVARMRRWREKWASNKKLHESLMAKLNEMQRTGMRKNKYRVQY